MKLINAGDGSVANEQECMREREKRARKKKKVVHDIESSEITKTTIMDGTKNENVYAAL